MAIKKSTNPHIGRRGHFNLPKKPVFNEAQINRINELSRVAKTNWLALIAYLSFIGVTLLDIA